MKRLKRFKITLGGKIYYGLTEKDASILEGVKRLTGRPLRHIINTILAIYKSKMDSYVVTPVEIKYVKNARISKSIRDAYSFYAKQNETTVVKLTASIISDFFTKADRAILVKELESWSDLIPSEKPQ